MTERALASPTPADLIWPAVNFVIFIGLLVYLLRGPVIEYFRARTARLRDALEVGARARREAADIRAALERDIANLPAQRAAVRADMRATAEQERDGLIAFGRTASDRIRNDARLLAEHEFAAARKALRSDLIDEAVREATALVRRAVRPEDQQRFVREFVAGVGDRS
jgi:F-type H+-transporting ATPase subunit b